MFLLQEEKTSLEQNQTKHFFFSVKYSSSQNIMNNLLKLNFNKGQDLPQGHVHLQPADKSVEKTKQRKRFLKRRLRPQSLTPYS